VLSTLFPLYFSVTDFRPDLFSWDRVVKMSPIERLEHAFSKAHTYLGIEKLLDPEGKVEILILLCISLLHKNLLNLILLSNFEHL
jgi:hypothetical protein